MFFVCLSVGLAGASRKTFIMDIFQSLVKSQFAQAFLGPKNPEKPWMTLQLLQANAFNLCLI